jgi:hypothetical protein
MLNMAACYALVLNFDQIIATFPSQDEAEEAFADVGCWVEYPGTEHVIEVLPLDEVWRRQRGSRA